LRPALDKEVIDEAESRIPIQVLEDDRVAGLRRQRAHVIEPHGLADVEMLTPVRVEKTLKIEHAR
jgi:hypothetical protein